VRDAPPVETASTPTDVQRLFRGLIGTGRLGSGERLPTVRQAAEDFGVAPGTVQKAYRALEAEGLIVSRVGSGTRVAPGVAVVSAGMARQLRAIIEAASADGVEIETLVDVLRLLGDDARSS